jgi:hypothetical protein
MNEHLRLQQEAIGEALCEAMCNQDDCVQAHGLIISAVEEWVSYHEKEARKWRALRISLQGRTMA